MISLFAAEYEEPKIGISGKEINEFYSNRENEFEGVIVWLNSV